MWEACTNILLTANHIFQECTQYTYQRKNNKIPNKVEDVLGKRFDYMQET